MRRLTAVRRLAIVDTASAACAAVTRWAFLRYGFVRIPATVMKGNVRSANFLSKSGFQYEGTLRSFRMVRGNPEDFEMYALLDSDLA